MKVLIVKLSAFGDIIHCLPALDDLIQRPEVSEIHWLIDSRYAFVAEIFPQPVTVHQVAMKGPRPISDIWKTIKKFRGIGFDVALDMQGLMKSAVMAAATGAHVFGIDRNELREKPASWLQHSVCFHPQERHVVQQYRRVANAPFLHDAHRIPEHAIRYAAPRIDLAKTAIASDAAFLERLHLQGRNYVVLHVAGGWDTKQLPEKTWLDVSHGLERMDILPLFSWGNEAEQKLAQKLAGQSNGYALPERLNMSALTALLGAAKAAIGADTGLLHLAAALGTPTVTFWGPSASWRSAPFSDGRGGMHCHIESNPACGPCFKRACDHFICMDTIQADAILGALNDT